jgi:hypothetical protein
MDGAFEEKARFFQNKCCETAGEIITSKESNETNKFGLIYCRRIPNKFAINLKVYRALRVAQSYEESIDLTVNSHSITQRTVINTFHTSGIPKHLSIHTGENSLHQL